MVTIGRPNLWLILIIIGQVSELTLFFFDTLAVSYNQPKFCSNVSWNQNATIFANSSTIGTTPYSIFINTDNTVYALNRIHNQIQMWLNDSMNLTRTISGGFSNSWSLFVTTNGDIYVDNTNTSSSVDKWALNSNSSVPVMYVSSACYSLFVDINDTLYCSINALHQVVTKSLNSVSNMTTIVAGTGCPGSISNMLYNPRGIFVNTNLDLYIADYTNNRIQLYQSGQLTGTTVTGVTSVNITYILVVTTYYPYVTGPFLIIASGLHNVILERLNSSSIIRSKYSSELTADSQIYARTLCIKAQYYYEAIQVNVIKDGSYTILSKSRIDTYGYIYKNSFNPFNALVNLMAYNDHSCANDQFRLTVNLEVGIKYILVVTTEAAGNTGAFEIIVSGPTNASLERINKTHDKCVIGGPCNSQVKGIGLTLDDILRYEINSTMTLYNQPLTVKISVALTMIMFVLGLINGILSIFTFQNESLRKVGCGIYLLASSITSLLTISMFTIKSWFVILTQMNSSISLSVLRGGCISIEPLLKTFLYFDTWLNACVAIERAMHVYKGVNFNKEKSKCCALRIIFILPFFITATVIHEPLHRDIFEYNVTTSKDPTKIIERYTWCVVKYSHSVQDFNTAVLFIHLIGPFIANLFSALFIIFGTARRRSLAQTNQSYTEHIRKQLHEHKQLLVSPAILLILSMPRLIISLLSGCVIVSDNIWLYLSAYFISFIPSILIFIIFVIPSKLYRKAFKDSFKTWQRRTRNWINS
ncbi:unnamed protein product [Adineta steineri]|uniref:G-protein coupled receptors family 1 profile domain-containing protein n=1 Tax=Adineta steineri TaxID=433720 RepID=A0A814RRS6_9BILA|nr:unnamed protein product [Adineta steineri]CAF1284331.1 unnamed protein product [Adineta steineri]